MSRVHDALRRAEQGIPFPEEVPPVPRADDIRGPEYLPVGGPGPASPSVRMNLTQAMLAEVPVVPFQPAPESHLLDLSNSHETPAEEFRTLRTRLNHLQTLQPLHTVVVTSPSPAEGKTFSAVNLALAQAHIAESSVLLGDFDLRRPIVHNLFQIDRTPGLSVFALLRVAPTSQRLCSGRSHPPRRGRDALGTAGKMPALPSQELFLRPHTLQ